MLPSENAEFSLDSYSNSSSSSSVSISLDDDSTHARTTRTRTLPPPLPLSTPSENKLVLLLQRAVEIQRNTTSPDVREAFTSVLAASLPFELLSLFVGMTRKSYRSSRAAYASDPHYVKRHDIARQNSIRRSSSEPVLFKLLDHFLHHASYVAFHTRTVHPPSDTSHAHSFPSLVSDLSPSHHYHDSCTM